jgi:hypothetical protein
MWKPDVIATPGLGSAETSIEYIDYSFYFEKVLEHNPSFLSLQ